MEARVLKKAPAYGFFRILGQRFLLYRIGFEIKQLIMRGIEIKNKFVAGVSNSEDSRT